MSHGYQAISWTPHKRRYDLALVGGVALYLAAFFGVGAATHPEASPETLLIRAFGTGAFLLLHLVLVIGPLARLDARFLPLLYNRRHMGVTMFLMALVHGGFSLLQFHGLGVLDPLTSALVSNPRYDSLTQFPFEAFGLGALVILFLMAATSHDFWLANLTAPTWKALHMLVYVAYGLLVLHVATGVLQSETSPLFTAALALGASTVLGLHLFAGLGGRALDVERGADADGWVAICPVEAIPEGKARIATVAGERVAVFRYEGRVSALSNVCQHQNGPLGEGRVIDGLVTCPWHGYQYDPACGRSPAPFTERVPTFRARVVEGTVQVHETPLPAGTETAPAELDGAEGAR